MSSIIYNQNNSLSRFNLIKNWAKILFTNDKKLQTTEIEELQDLINNQVGAAFNTLYNFFTIIKGCKIIILKINTNNYECLLTEGQIYVDIKNRYYFIDTPPHNFTISRNQTSFVGINLNIQLVSDEDDYYNPQTGGAVFGSPGSNRITITPTIQVQIYNNLITNYPIALIKPKTLNLNSTFNNIGDNSPCILYYKNEELTQYNNELNLSTYIKNLIELRLFESSGNFISKGMNVTVNTKTNVLTISPGVAYINGKRINTNYNNYFQIDPNNINSSDIQLNKQYLFYLTEEGQFKYTFQEDQTQLIEVPNNSLAVAYIVFNTRNSLLIDYSIIEAPSKMPLVSELINLNKSNEDNIKELANLILKADLLNLSSNAINNDLNGIFTDAFVDLNNTDIFYPSFAASILPTIKAISLPFTSTNKNNRNFNIDLSESNVLIESTLNDNNELVPYWCTINGSELKLFNTPLNVTGSLLIPITTNNNIIVSCSPSILYKSDANTFVNYSHPNLIKLKNNEDVIIVDTPFNNDIYLQPIKVTAVGFNGLQDNIKVQLNNINITNFNIITGTVGSTTGTLKADNNGSLVFTFNIPKIDEADIYIVSLFYGNTTGTAQIKILDPEISRINKERNINFIDNTNYKYPVINSGVSQTFFTTSPIMVKAIDCIIMDYPTITSSTLLNIQIASLNSTGQPVEILGIGSLQFSEVSIITKDTPIPNTTRINLDRPVNLSRGNYALIFNTNIAGIKLGITKAGQSRLLDNNSFFYDPLKTDVLIYDNGWSNDAEVDNIVCDLILHKPLSLVSNTIIDINSNTDFDVIDINSSISGDINSYTNMFILNENNQYEQIKNGSFFFKRPVNSSKLKILIKGTTNTHPIISLDNLNINLISNLSKAIWISRNQEYETAYTNLSMSVDVYKPNNTNFNFYFSSNKGDTWELLDQPLIENVDSSLNINKYTFKKESLGLVVLNSELYPRYNLRYKIEFELINKDGGIPPFFKNIVSITSA